MLLYFENSKDDPLGFNVACHEKDQPKFAKFEVAYENKHVRVAGYISEFKGRPQIKITEPSQIEVVGEAGESDLGRARSPNCAGPSDLAQDVPRSSFAFRSISRTSILTGEGDVPKRPARVCRHRRPRGLRGTARVRPFAIAGDSARADGCGDRGPHRSTQGRRSSRHRLLGQHVRIGIPAARPERDRRGSSLPGAESALRCDEVARPARAEGGADASEAPERRPQDQDRSRAGAGNLRNRRGRGAGAEGQEAGSGRGEQEPAGGRPRRRIRLQDALHRDGRRPLLCGPWSDRQSSLCGGPVHPLRQRRDHLGSAAQEAARRTHRGMGRDHS